MFGHSLLQTLMPLGSGAYVPSLRWRQAEYQALLRLDESIKDRIVPLITTPPIEFDFEAGIPEKTMHEHVHPFILDATEVRAVELETHAAEAESDNAELRAQIRRLTGE